MEVIEIDSLNKSYGSDLALDNFTLNVHSGNIYGLLGPNGAGKTTAIEIMLGLRKSDSGSVKVFGVDPQLHYNKIASRIGAMLQQGGINPGLKPREAINLYRSFYPNSYNTDELLKLIDLDGVSTVVRRLSGGQAQSLSLALAIVGYPELVFLDEPTVGMDPHARRRTWDIIRSLRDRGATVILTSHLMDEAEMLCDEIAIVSHGKVIEHGKTTDLTSTQHCIDIEFDSPVDVNDISNKLNVNCSLEASTLIRVDEDIHSDFFFRLSNYAKSNNLTIIKYLSQSKKLEDIFIELTKEQVQDE